MCAHGDAERFDMEGGPSQHILQEGFSKWPSLAMRRPDLMERWAARQCRRDIYVLHQDGKIATVELQPEGDNAPFVDVLPSRGASAYIGGRGQARDEAGGVDDLEVGSCNAELFHVLLPEETAVESFDLTVDDTPAEHFLPIGAAIESFRLDWDDHSADEMNLDDEVTVSAATTAATLAATPARLTAGDKAVGCSMSIGSGSIPFDTAVRVPSSPAAPDLQTDATTPAAVTAATPADPILQSDVKLWPHNVIAEVHGKPMIQDHFASGLEVDKHIGLVWPLHKDDHS